MLAHASVWEALKATSKVGYSYSIVSARHVASARPSSSAGLQTPPKRPLRCRLRHSAYSKGGEQQDALTFHEDEVGSSQISSEDAGLFSTLSIEPIGKNSRRIVVSIAIDAPLQTLWSVLTDYEHLADFIPGLAICKVEERWENGARLFQIGEQKLALGLKFKATGVINVQEQPAEVLSSSICRRIDFEMIKGDFQIFKGCWQMEEELDDRMKSADAEVVASSSRGTILTYIIDVQPKIWLPVGLVEGILSKEIQNNLLSVRNQVLKVQSMLPAV